MNNNVLRTIARSNEMQTLYSRSKDMGLKLFDNNKDFTNIQIIFLSYLELYHGLYKDIAMLADCIGLKTLEDDMDVDAYLVWRKSNQKKDERGSGKSKKKKQKQNDCGIPTVVFRDKRR